MKKMLAIALLCLVITSCDGCCGGGIQFTSADFPISVSAECEEAEDECDDVENAILIFNEMAGLDVFELSPDAGQITIQFSSAKLHGNQGVQGTTEYCGEDIEITVKKYIPAPQCVIQHELGHALGLHEHFDSRPNLMSSDGDCFTPDLSEDGSNDYFDLFYEWFQEKYLKEVE